MEGDKNSKYFQAIIKERRIEQNAFSLKTEEGDIITDMEQTIQKAEDYYKICFSSEPHFLDP